jgi:hypothetical protein
MTGEYFWANDSTKTLEAFCKVFYFVKVRNYDYGDRADINFSVDLSEEVGLLHGLRASKWLYNNFYNQIVKGKYYSNGKYIDGKYTYKNRYSKILKERDCTLTGYGVDYDILEPVFKFIDKPKEGVTIEEVISDCLWAWVYACQRDYEAQFEEANIIDYMEANEYEFTEDGERA